MKYRRIVLSPYEENNLSLMLHVGRENGVYVTEKGGVYYLEDEDFQRFRQEWEIQYNQLFIYCEKYKMLAMPYLRLARRKKLNELIEHYNLNGKYKDKFKQILVEVSEWRKHETGL